MNLVIDTSVIIAVIANEPQKPLLIQRTRDFVLVAPSSVHWEIGNAFSAMLKRKRISLSEANTAIEIYRQIPLNLIAVDLLVALDLASNHNIYAYDAYIMACALNQNCPLLSLDKGLLHAAKLAGVETLQVE